MYVLVTSVDPLWIYFYKEGIVRHGTKSYNLKNLSWEDWKFIHLTNHSVNKKNTNFQGENKTYFTDLLDKLHEAGHDEEELLDNIKDIIRKTIISIQPKLSHNYRVLQPQCKYHDKCFELLGFDIMLDSSLKPWLLEVNSFPSFSTETRLDENIKWNLIIDTL